MKIAYGDLIGGVSGDMFVGALLDLGLEPHLLSETLIESMFAAIERHRDRVILDHILPTIRWRPPAREKQTALE